MDSTTSQMFTTNQPLECLLSKMIILYWLYKKRNLLIVQTSYTIIIDSTRLYMMSFLGSAFKNLSDIVLKSQQKLPLSHTKAAPVRSHTLDLNKKHLRETRETGQVDEYCLPLLAEFLSIHPFGATSESRVFPKKTQAHSACQVTFQSSFNGTFGSKGPKPFNRKSISWWSGTKRCAKLDSDNRKTNEKQQLNHPIVNSKL